jgi:hypothetical protein
LTPEAEVPPLKLDWNPRIVSRAIVHSPPPPMDRRTFTPDQKLIKTGQTEDVVRRDKPAWGRE